MITVWIEEWQQYCCGDPFELGSRVTWHVEPVDADYLVTRLGLDQPVTHRQDHHGDGERDTTGRVQAIRAVHARYGPRPGGNPMDRILVEGSAVTRSVRAAERADPDYDGLTFVGYLVELKV